MIDSLTQKIIIYLQRRILFKDYGIFRTIFQMIIRFNNKNTEKHGNLKETIEITKNRNPTIKGTKSISMNQSIFLAK